MEEFQFFGTGYVSARLQQKGKEKWKKEEQSKLPEKGVVRKYKVLKPHKWYQQNYMLS